MQQALEALRNVGNALMVIAAGRNLRQLYGEMRDDAVNGANKAITALREALAHSGEANEMVIDWEAIDKEQLRRYKEKFGDFEQAEHEPFDINDHPPHRLCECRKCMEYFTPLPDCDAFAAFGKPIAEQEPVAWHHPQCEGQCIACLIEKAVQDAYGTQGRDYMLRHINAAPVRTKDQK